MPASAQDVFACSEENIQHWYSIQFNIPLVQVEFISPDFPTLLVNTDYWIKYSTNSNEIFEVRDKVFDQLTDMGYIGRDTVTGITFPILPQHISPPLQGWFPELYSTICADGGIMAVVGGMLLQPDSATLVLAYGIANAIWLVPSVAGIGIAVYLTKNRWQKH